MVYTGQLRLPRPYEAPKQQRRPSQLAAFLGTDITGDLSKPAPFAKRLPSFVSDSDGEDGVNESLRDRRLAFVR